MAHEITERRDGTAEAAFAMTPAWHGLGTVLDHPMSSAEALATAQLDWTVIQRPMAIGTPKMIQTAEGEVEGLGWAEVPGLLANVRGDNGYFLGQVSEQYKIVQNTEAFAFLDQLIQDHEMTYESAFSLRGGKRVCLLGRLPAVDTVVEGDDVLRYVLLSLHHDGTGAIKFGPTSVRVVCANTYAVALKEGHVQELSISHTGDVANKLERARQILFEANAAFNDHAEHARALAAHRMTIGEWSEYLDLLCPQLDPKDPDYTEYRAAKLDETRAAIQAAYRNERQSLDGIARTAWAAYNAVSEHIDHLPRRGATRKQKAEARFNVNLYGAGRDMKRRAFEAACRFANVTLAT